jgi:hypothetical protein
MGMDLQSGIEIVSALGVGLGIGLSKGFLKPKGEEGQGQKPKDNDLGCADHQEQIARLQEQVSNHSRELESGSKRFEKLERTLNRIGNNVVLLLERSHSVRKDD